MLPTCMILALLLFVSGCGEVSKPGEVKVEVTDNTSGGARDNTPTVREPVRGGEKVIGNDYFEIDATNQSDGYLYVTYSGDKSAVKLQLTAHENTTYTYNLDKGDTVIPITEGSGEYKVVLYEGIGGNEFAAAFSDNVTLEVQDEFKPFLAPNTYVWFDKNTEAVDKASELASGCTCDLEVVAEVYRFVVGNITYDEYEAENVASSYKPDVDEVLSTKKGICFDYASLMAAMLRSQHIPTRLEIGYAGDNYHAWISTFVEDRGWIDKVITFDGKNWTLMDPTFAANMSSGKFAKFIGDGENYYVMYKY